MNTAVGESAGHTTTSGSNGHIELLQRLGDRVVHDAKELAARIREETEAESARFIEDVNKQAREIINNAQRQAKAAAEPEERPSVKVQEDIGKHAMEVVAKILDELLSSLDYLAERAKALEEELRAATTVTGDEATSKACVRPEAAAEANEAVSELHSELKDVIGSVDTSEVEPSSPERTGETGVAVEVETAATSEPKFPQEDSELFYGEVKIDIAPPVNIMRLLGLIRSLENTRGIRILGTSGSRNSGSVIAMSLDKPLPLLSLLRDMPFVEGVKAEDKPVPSSAPEQSTVRRVSVATKDGGCVRLGSNATFGRSAS